MNTMEILVDAELNDIMLRGWRGEILFHIIVLASCGFVACFCPVINNNVCTSVVSVYGRRVFRVVKNESL